MTAISVRNLGKLGIISDPPAYSLPVGAWSAGQNVSFADDMVHKAKGFTQRMGTPTIAPYNIMFVPNSLWVYAGLTKVYSTNGISHNNITRQTASVDVDYATNADIGWNGCFFNGVLVLNNGVDVPQVWPLPIGATNKLIPLANWPANTTAKVIRRYKTFLLAMNILSNGVEYKQRLMWSHPADPGAVPASWDYASVTTQAGIYDIGAGGELIDSLPLGHINVLYKSDQIQTMQFVGGVNIFAFDPKWDFGILSRRCVQEIKKMHIVWTPDDVISHNAVTWDSIIDKRNRKWLFNQIDGAYYKRSFMAANYKANELWLCFVQGGSGATVPNMALVWNWADNTYTVRELPHVYDIAAGDMLVAAVDDSWDTDNATWDSDNTIWASSSESPLSQGTLMASPTNTKLFEQNSGETANGVTFTSYVERTGLALAGVDRFGQPFVEPRSVKTLTEVFPIVEAPVGTVIEVYLGVQQDLTGNVSWAGPFNFTVGTSRFIDHVMTGRAFAFKFQSQDSTKSWAIQGFDAEIKIKSKY